MKYELTIIETTVVKSRYKFIVEDPENPDKDMRLNMEEDLKEMIGESDDAIELECSMVSNPEIVKFHKWIREPSSPIETIKFESLKEID